MQGGGKFPGKGPMDQALPVEAGKALEGRGDDFDPEMGFAFGAVTGMAPVAVRFVNDFKAKRVKGLCQHGFDALVAGGGHGDSVRCAPSG